MYIRDDRSKSTGDRLVDEYLAALRELDIIESRSRTIDSAISSVGHVQLASFALMTFIMAMTGKLEMLPLSFRMALSANKFRKKTHELVQIAVYASALYALGTDEREAKERVESALHRLDDRVDRPSRAERRYDYVPTPAQRESNRRTA